MYGFPLNYDKINDIAARYTPTTVKAYNNYTFDYFFRALFQRACSVFEFDLPEEWTGSIYDFFLYCLFANGYVGVFNDNKFGLSFQPGTTYGLNFYYQPTTFKVSNPKLKKDFTIGQTCELIKLTPDFKGIWDIIGHSAEQMAALDMDINTNIINTKFGFILAGKNKAAAMGLKKVIDRIFRGEPAVIVDKYLANESTSKDTPFQVFESIKDRYLVPEMLLDLGTLLKNFDAEIGICGAPYQKAERMTEFESESHLLDSTARAMTWKRCLDDSFDKVNNMFGTKMSCKFRYIPDDDPMMFLQSADEINKEVPGNG